ncbi:MAG TPA: hypothetical protein VLE27_00255 [Thermoanaerobaculia bacterium]|nr:hypothetical protein [Thermoanaerobaculia bacterium]
MQVNQEGIELNRLSGLVTVLLIAGSLLLLSGDVVPVLQSGGFLWTVLLWLAFVCFGAGILLLPLAFSWTDRPLVVAGVACAFVGCFAGAGMQVLFRALDVLKGTHQAAAVSLLQTHTLLSLSTLAPGILFPIGLLLLSGGLMRSRALPLGLSLTLALGAVLFPIGHAVGFAPALVFGDVILVAAFFGLFIHRRSIGMASSSAVRLKATT